MWCGDDSVASRRSIVYITIYAQTLLSLSLSVMLLLWVVYYLVSAASVLTELFPPLLPLSAPVSSTPSLSSFLLHLCFSFILSSLLLRHVSFAFLCSFVFSVHFTLTFLHPSSVCTHSLPPSFIQLASFFLLSLSLVLFSLSLSLAFSCLSSRTVPGFFLLLHLETGESKKK